MAYKHHKQCILVGHHSHTHQPYPWSTMHYACVFTHAHDYMDLLVKVVDIICPSCTRYDNADAMQVAHGVCALRVLVSF